ncbi:MULTISPECIES: acetate/propionate family kinase [Clostridium]|uniref:Acetate kinase n=1 Tax=Clostridium nitritogenes TaxID=83340 RepID=A0ABP3WVS2_9CLOT|nr:acetate kinase [Clostridium baratii]AQM60772.1 acetate kinase [Clostridium baratii]KJU71347.1 acetate kinase [Clostridium baratii]MBT9832571.1 acetate/propionate family kinase [Clostridium baratii]MDU1855129.1 acetate kinase [Clostridium baratii]STA99502.1 acetate kinase [Clostridium baratii]
MKILVINCGSSSLKYQLINMENEEVLAQGLVERIGIEGSILTQKVEGRDKYIIEQPMKDHQDAIKLVLDALVDDTHGVIKSMDEISAVGHRVVHGGEKYSKSVLVDDEVMNYLEECVKLAPLHNPPNIIGINACKALMPNTPMAVVFDTAFHQTMPAKAFTYAIPYELYQKHGIRRYGFHGTSHKYVSRKVAEVMGKNIEDLKIITCHLGNGGSLTAVDGGKSVDTSMGFTPLEGIVMGTRSGNIDPAIITYLINELGYTSEEVNTMLNKKSGLLGISELSSDFRDIRDAAFDRKEERAILTKDVFFYSIKKQIGAYAAAMGGVDVIVFTAGIGENSIETREGVLEGLEFLGVKLDKEKNAIRADINEISTDDSRVKAYVIATNEELMIAKETLELIN